MDTNKFKKAISLLKSARQYVKWANHTAESRFDNPESEYYDDGGQYEIMEETEKLMAEIDEIVGPPKGTEIVKTIGIKTELTGEWEGGPLK